MAGIRDSKAVVLSALAIRLNKAGQPQPEGAKGQCFKGWRVAPGVITDVFRPQDFQDTDSLYHHMTISALLTLRWLSE